MIENIELAERMAYTEALLQEVAQFARSKNLAKISAICLREAHTASMKEAQLWLSDLNKKIMGQVVIEQAVEIGELGHVEWASKENFFELAEFTRHSKNTTTRAWRAIGRLHTAEKAADKGLIVTGERPFDNEEFWGFGWISLSMESLDAFVQNVDHQAQLDPEFSYSGILGSNTGEGMINLLRDVVSINPSKSDLPEDLSESDS